MRLVKGIIRRYRGISHEVQIDFPECCVIVGRNDSGKSTILKAIDLFLNDNEALPDMVNAYADDPKCEIELHFEPARKQIIIDESVPTTLEDEELINEDGLVVVKKVWDTSKSKITPDTYLLRKIYGDKDFLLKTENELITLCRHINIQTQKANGEEYNNVEKRLKIRTLYQEDNTAFTFEFEKLPTTGRGRGKILFDELKRILPRFEYFHADSSLSESDTAIQKYFKQISTQLLKESGVDTLEESVRNGIAKVLGKITGKINSVVPQEQQVEPQVSFNWTNLVQTSFRSKTDGTDVPLHFRGDGFRRVTMMSYFEYLAEENKAEHQSIIFGFEEPETFLHPSAQEQLHEKLVGLKEAGYQVLITTHSPIIVSKTLKHELIHIEKDGRNYHLMQNLSDLSSIISDLGITPTNQFIREFEKAKAIVLVEGADDVKAFDYVANTYKANKVIDASFNDLGIVLLPIGGCDSVIHWHALNILTNLGKPYFIIQDSDKDGPSSISRNEQVLQKLGLNRTDYWVLRKRALENYINPLCLSRRIPGICIGYDEYTPVKDLCKTHPKQISLGGKKVADKHFCHQTFDELRFMFNSSDGSDEFLSIYGGIKLKLERCGAIGNYSTSFSSSFLRAD
jgi:putative ATP-dependent endonuclease of OLD family